MVAKSRTKKTPAKKAKTAAAKKARTKPTPAKKATTKKASANKAPMKKAPAKKASAQRKASGAAATRKPRSARGGSTSTSPPVDAQLESIAVEDVSAGDDVATTETAAKKGPLARLAGGVGNLFARMTAKKEPAPPDPNHTIELVTGDILHEADAPPPIPATRPKTR
jgi:diacylglycerol O-acyltransferase / wax synthase